MATLVVDTITRDGLNPTMVAAAGGGDQFANTGKEFVEVDNADAAPMTATFVTQKTVDGQAVGDRAVTVPAGERRIIGPFDPSVYNDSNGNLQITYSAVTSVTVGVRKT